VNVVDSLVIGSGWDADDLMFRGTTINGVAA
jgi:hypothetical protein